MVAYMQVRGMAISRRPGSNCYGESRRALWLEEDYYYGR
jgi:hypothetical protein